MTAPMSIPTTKPAANDAPPQIHPNDIPTRALSLPTDVLPETRAFQAAGSETRSTTWAPAGYEIVGTLGQGGMGVVWQARQTALKRMVALKMLRGTAPDALSLARFQAEAVARLRHPHIVHQPNSLKYLVLQGTAYAHRGYVLRLANQTAEGRTWSAKAVPILQAVLQRAPNNLEAVLALKIAQRAVN